MIKIFWAKKAEACKLNPRCECAKVLYLQSQSPRYLPSVELVHVIDLIRRTWGDCPHANCRQRVLATMDLSMEVDAHVTHLHELTFYTDSVQRKGPNKIQGMQVVSNHSF